MPGGCGIEGGALMPAELGGVGAGGAGAGTLAGLGAAEAAPSVIGDMTSSIALNPNISGRFSSICTTKSNNASFILAGMVVLNPSSGMLTTTRSPSLIPSCCAEMFDI